MAFEMQELSSSSSSDIDRLDQSDFEVGDSEIVRALSQPQLENLPRAAGRSRFHTAFRAFGVLLLVVGVVAALGFIFYGERERVVEQQQQLYDELKQVEIFVQYIPEAEFEELDGDALKMTDPPPI